MKCMYCGAPMNDDERLCSYCGEKQKIDEKIWKETSCNVVVNVYHHEPEGRERVVYVDHPVRRVSDRNRLVSLLLCFFLGFDWRTQVL